MSQLTIWPALGWVRAVEITRGRDGSAHPHYHCLLMVPPTYFQADYLKQSEWAWLWQECLRVNYRPVIDVKTVKADDKGRNVSGPEGTVGLRRMRTSIRLGSP